MGTINYRTSPIITLGTIPATMTDYEAEAETEASETGRTPEEIALYLIQADEEADAENADHIIQKFRAEYFTIRREPGYYQGNYIMIDDSRPEEYDPTEREQARIDVNELEKALIELAGVGYMETFPGWCTGYSSYAETVESIKAAANKLREEIETAPSWTPEARTA